MDIKEYLKDKAEYINKSLEAFTPSESSYPEIIHKAMLYSLTAGGKRLRPALVMMVAEIFGTPVQNVLPTACALEMLHTYTLIHDDLPCMDNDDYRRGRLTNHKVFGEAMALLAGDALLTAVFGVISKYTDTDKVEPHKILQVITEISESAGSQGVIGGQVVDMLSQDSNLDKSVLEYIHVHKTGKLILVSVRAGAILSGATAEQLDALTVYAEKIGLAFQIIDDILDICGDEKKLGKPIGSDAQNHKLTFPAIYGLEESRELAKLAVQEAKKSLDLFGDKAWALKELADYIISRDS